jgi:hypothetical protein
MISWCHKYNAIHSRIWKQITALARAVFPAGPGPAAKQELIAGCDDQGQDEHLRQDVN